MVAKLPLTTVPPPISSVIKPLALVVTVCVSTYTAAPVALPCRMEICTPTACVATRLLPASRTTAWYENFCGAWANAVAKVTTAMKRNSKSFFIFMVI